MKKNEIKTSRYLSDLEDRIGAKFDSLLIEDFPTLVLSDEEKRDLKQITKFVISKEENDVFTKEFDINRIGKFLLSHEEKTRQKAALLLHVLRKMGQLSLVSTIINNMKISVGVKELILRESSVELQIKYQDAIEDILSVLDENKYGLNIIQNVNDKYSSDIANISISLNGEAKEHIFNLSEKSHDVSAYLKTLNTSGLHPFNFFIFIGDLEAKLGNVVPKTWARLNNSKTNQEIICFYLSPNPQTSILSQTEQGYTCKTLRELLSKINKSRKLRKKKQSNK